jgi:large subunit ribosomal protein L29
MKGMKVRDIWQMSSEDRQKKLKELKDDLMHERGTGAMGGALKSPGRVKAIRTSIAQILTIEGQTKRLEAQKAEVKRKAEARKKAEEARKAKEAERPAKPHKKVDHAKKRSSIKKEEKTDG